MWPFDDPKNQIPTTTPRKAIGPAPLVDSKDLKIQELEQRIFGIECAFIQLCTAMKQHQDVCNVNFQAVEQSFVDLIGFIARPRASIMGDDQERN